MKQTSSDSELGDREDRVGVVQEAIETDRSWRSKLAERVVAAVEQGPESLAAMDRELFEAERTLAEAQLIRTYFEADYLSLLQKAHRAQQAERLAKEAAQKAAREAAEHAAREETLRAEHAVAEEAEREATQRETSRLAKEAKIAAADRAAREVKAVKTSKAAKAKHSRNGRHPKKVAGKARTSGHRRPRRLNLKVATILVTTAASLALGIYLLHGFQVTRTADRMLSRAVLAEKEGNLDQAIHYYDYYVRYRPEADEEYTKLALLVTDQTKRAGSNPQSVLRAYRMLERAAIRKRDNLDVIRQLAEISMKVGQTKVAEEHLKRLMQVFPEESDLEVKLGRCQVASEHKREALSSFQRVIGRDSKNLDAYIELARLFRTLDDSEQAEATLDQMVSANAASARAYLERGKFRREIEQTEQGNHDILRALEMAPDDVNVLLAAADVAMDAKKLELARNRLARAQKQAPDDERVHRALAMLSVSAGKTDEAINHLQTAVEKVSDNPIAMISLADLQLKKGDLVAVRRTIKLMRKAAFREEVLEYFEAQILVAEGKWWEASGVLERLRAKVMGWPEFRSRVELFLGACYEQLRLPDRQLDMYQRVLAEEPTMLAARIGYAAALFSTGNYDKARQEYTKLEETMGSEEFLKAPAVRNNVFQLIVARTEQLPEADRDWTELEQFLDKLEKVKDLDPVQRTLMRAELLVKTGKAGQAREMIRALSTERPKEAALWTALAKVTAMEQKPEDGLAVLDEAAEQIKESLALRLARIDLAVLLDPARGRPILAPLGENTERLSEAERVRLWQALGAAYYRLRDRDQAQQLWKRVADAQSRDVQTLLTLFALAVESDDDAAVDEAMQRIHKLLGSRSAEANYCEAVRLVEANRGSKPDQKTLERAKQLLASAAQERPGWFEIPRLEAEIALQEGLLDDAIERFQRASELGPLSPLYLGKLVRLLYTRGRYEEAKKVMTRLARWENVLNLRKLEAELTLLTGNLDQALQLASQTVEHSKQATDFLWYAQLLARAKKNQEAQKMCRRALELDSQIPEAWLGLMALLVDAGRRDEAQQMLREAQTRLPEDRTPLVLAQGYQMLGDLTRAEQQYQQAVSFDANNPSVVNSIARFYLQTGRNQQARQYLQQMLKLAERDPTKYQEESSWARRALARVLASTDDHRQLQQAMKLLDENARSGKLPVEDMRLKAEMLASRPDRGSRQKAIRLLEDLRGKRRQTLTPREQLTLARLHQELNDWDRCQDEMLDLLAIHGDRPEVLVAYIEMLLRNGEPASSITNWFDKLEKLDPNAPVTKGLKAKLLVKDGKTAEAVKVLEGLIPRPLAGDQLGRLRGVAELLEELKQYDEATKLLEELANRTSAGNLTLAAYLARRGKLDEALQRCEKAIQESVPIVNVLPVAVNILEQQHSAATAAHYQKVEAWCQRAGSETPDSKLVQWQTAALRQLYAPRKELVRTYREFLKRKDLSDMEKAVVWNNLAFMLAAGGEADRETLAMVNRAIEIIGPSANLLDTRGIVQLSLGQAKQAIADLEQSIAENSTGVAYFHLALAHHAANNPEAALRALQQARDHHQLTAEQIPLVERPRYEQLVASLRTR